MTRGGCTIPRSGVSSIPGRQKEGCVMERKSEEVPEFQGVVMCVCVREKEKENERETSCSIELLKILKISRKICICANKTQEDKINIYTNYITRHKNIK